VESLRGHAITKSLQVKKNYGLRARVKLCHFCKAVVHHNGGSGSGSGWDPDSMTVDPDSMTVDPDSMTVDPD
jgi:hypothetical protein